MHELMMGLSNLGSPAAIGYLVVGAVIGMIVGVIPGLSAIVVLSIILTFSYHISTTGALCLFLGAKCGGFYSASVSAILLNTPSHPEAFPITFDGYPMALKGQPGRALGLSAASTAVGGVIGCVVLAACLPLIDDLNKLFHPPDYVALITLALLLVGTLTADSISKSLVAAGAGLMLSSIGSSVITGTLRYSFGVDGLLGGISLSALVLGIFAATQMAMVFGTGKATATQDMSGRELVEAEAIDVGKGHVRELFDGVLETFRHWKILLQGGLLGAVTGMVPGIGGFTGNMMAYSIARQTSRQRKLFGTGVPDGIIAPEGSSLAKEAGHMVPMLGLGIPGGAVGALFIGVLAIKGMGTGSGFLTAYPGIAGEIVWTIALSGVIATLAGVLLGPQIAKVTRLPGPIIVPFIFAFCVSGPYFADSQFFAVWLIPIFGVAGLALRRTGYPLASFVLALVLGPEFETNIYLTRNVYGGFGWITERPLADTIFAICILLAAWKAFEVIRSRRKVRANFAEQLASAADATERRKLIRRNQLCMAPYPLLSLVVSVVALAASIFFIIYGQAHYDFATRIMPVIGGFGVALPALFFVPKDAYRYVLYRRAKSAEASDAENGSAFAKSENQPNDIRLKGWGRTGQYTREVVAFAWLVGLVVACWLIGFEYGTALFMFLYGLTATGRQLRTWKQRLLFTIPSTAFIWIVTYELFHLTSLSYVPKISL